MTKKQRISYEAVLQALGKSPRVTLPAEFHGYICGVFCGNNELSDTVQLELVTGFLLEECGIDQLSGELFGFVLNSKAELESDDFDFQLLLPNDDESMSVRLKALSAWCESFLLAIGLTGLRQQTAVLSEMLRDIAEITHVKYDESDFTEASENEYMELVEYMRASVLLIYMENRH